MSKRNIILFGLTLWLSGFGIGLPVGLFVGHNNVADQDRIAMQEAIQYQVVAKPSDRTPDNLDQFVLGVSEKCSGTQSNRERCINHLISQWKDLAYGPNYYVVDLVNGTTKPILQED